MVALAAAGSACAQSSVTLFGVVDAALSWGRGSVSNRFQLTNSGNSSSRLVFRGVEDLGAGLFASFWLEAGLNNDDGRGAATNTNNQASGGAAAIAGSQGLTFNRRSTVSLGGSWGELRFGRDYVPQFYAYNQFDPFAGLGAAVPTTYAAIAAIPTSTRASNSIGYLLPARLGGVYGQVMYYAGENPSNAPGGTHDDGTGAGIRIGYAQGPINVAAATGRTNYAAGDATVSNLAGQYDFGGLRFIGHLARSKVGAITSKGGEIGGIYSLGASEFKAAYSTYKTDAAGPTDPKSSKMVVGYVYNFSKRTALYTTYAHVKNSGGATLTVNGAATAANNASNGLDIGLRHAF